MGEKDDASEAWEALYEPSHDFPWLNISRGLLSGSMESQNVPG